MEKEEVVVEVEEEVEVLGVDVGGLGGDDDIGTITSGPKPSRERY